MSQRQLRSRSGSGHNRPADANTERSRVQAKRGTIALQSLPGKTSRTNRTAAHAAPVAGRPDKKLLTTTDQYYDRISVQDLARSYSAVWPHSPSLDLTFPDETISMGARYCRKHAETLEKDEAVIKRIEPLMMCDLVPRESDGRYERNTAIEYDEARFQYRSLIIETIIDAVNDEIKQDHPAASGMAIRKTPPLEYDSAIIMPFDSYTIYDEDLAVPAMSLYLPPNKAQDNYQPNLGGSHGTGFSCEMALQMKLHDKENYQGMVFDGVAPQLLFAHVQRPADCLSRHKTDFANVTYSMPELRNGFVADMVNLLLNYKDYRKVYKYSMKSGEWNARKHELVTY